MHVVANGNAEGFAFISLYTLVSVCSGVCMWLCLTLYVALHFVPTTLFNVRCAVNCSRSTAVRSTLNRL